jgi:hypothetical protein
MRRAWAEFGLVVLTGAAHLVFENIYHAKGPFIACAGLFWAAYIGWRLRAPGQARAWGMRADTFRSSLTLNALLFAAGAGGMIVYGASRGRLLPSCGFFYLLALYPLWGFVQHFLLCALIGRNVRAITGSSAAAGAAGAVLFSLSHIPDWTLCGLTAVAGVAWLALYFRRPNLWVQGGAHGWLGAVAYYYVLGRDPWLELMQGLQ